MRNKYLAFFILLFLSFSDSAFASFDLESVKSSWISWTNTERSLMGSSNLVQNTILDNTASEWSEFSKTRGYIDHKRQWQKAYYDYKKIGKWFSDRWVTFKKIKKVTFSESIWWNTYSCSKDDCTDELKSAVKKTFNFYMKEKWKKYWPHYKAMIKKEFSQIWIWIVVDKAKGKYYITVHYWTEVSKK